MSTRPDSAVSRWVENGGRLHHSIRTRQTLHSEALESEGFDPYPYIVHKGNKPKMPPLLTSLAVPGFIVAVILYLVLGDGIFSSGGQQSPEVLPTPTNTFTDYAAAGVPGSVIYAPDVASIFDMTPTETPTPAPTLTPTITPTPFPGQPQQRLQIRIGWFNPALGGSHCPSDVECADLPLDDGKQWIFRLGQVAACPPEFGKNAWVVVEFLGAWECVHKLPLAKCDYPSLTCDILVLSRESIVPDWLMVYDATVYTR